MDKYLNISKPSKSIEDPGKSRPIDQDPGTSRPMDVDHTSDSLTTKKASAPIWKHFIKATPSTDSTKSKAQCKYCKTNIANDYGNTSSMIRHLRSKHEELFSKYEQERKKDLDKPKKAKISDPREVKISDSFNKTTPYLTDHPKSVALTNEIGKWMALNLHPYTLVEEEGFRNVMHIADPRYEIPSRSTFSRRVIPDLVTSVKNEVKNSLTQEQNKMSSISFTSDMWTSGNNVSYLALTSHYVTDNFEIRSNCLGNYHFKGQHTAENICIKIEQCFNEWELPTVPLHIETDNARNIISAVNKMKQTEGLTCFAHTLQLTIKDAKSHTTSISHTLSKARTIVGHFKKSPQDTQKLIGKQVEMGMEPKKLIQNVETRWNSEYFMLNRLVELRKPLSLVMLDIKKVESFTSQEWLAAEYYVEILGPLASTTEEVSGNRLPTRSMIIPVINEISEHLETFIAKHVGEAGVSFARALLQAVKSRFPLYANNNETDVLCMIVDPRFKMVYLNDEQKKLSKNLFKKVVCKSIDVTDTSSSDAADQGAQEENSQNTKPSKWSALKKLAGAKTSNVNSKITQAGQEVDTYLQEPLLDTSSNPLEWWKQNSARFPTLEKTVKQFIGIPATEVASERVFSAAGMVVNEKRERLLTQHVEELVFL